MSLTFDLSRCLQFAEHRLMQKFDARDTCQAIGATVNGEITAVYVFSSMSEYDIEISIAAVDTKRWASKEFLRAFYRYPFVQLGVKRITAHIHPSNEPSLKAAERFGFKREGVARQWFGNEDAILMGLIEPDFRYRKLI